MTFFENVSIVYIIVSLFILTWKTFEAMNFKKVISKLNKRIEELSEDYDSDRDFKHLKAMINFEVKNCLNSEIILKFYQKEKALLKDSELNNFVEVTSKAVIGKLSNGYIDMLIIRYFKSRQEFINFLTEYAYSLAHEAFFALNKQKIKKFKKTSLNSTEDKENSSQNDNKIVDKKDI